MSDIIYVGGKLGAAMTALATGRGRIKARLLHACNEGLYGVSPAAFSRDEDRRKAQELVDRLFRTGRTVDVVIDEMDEDDAVHLAEIINHLEVAASSQIHEQLSH